MASLSSCKATGPHVAEPLPARALRSALGLNVPACGSRNRRAPKKLGVKVTQ